MATPTPSGRIAPKDPRNRFTPRWLPRIIGVAAFALFLLTLNHWVTLANLDAVAKVAGWTWQPEEYRPLVYLTTRPFHWLPVAMVPMALNVFAALCGALTLAMLARSVAILPHDRTEAEREAERSDFSFMTTKMAWLPPILAAAMCGLHAGFWHNATNFTGEMLQLTVFAFVIWQILEFRLDERDGRLFLACFAYGLGVADNWALPGFFPFFVLALIWSKGVEFFHPKFLGKAILCGLVGESLFFVLPLIDVTFHHDLSLSFWDYLRPNLAMNWHALKLITNPDVRYNMAIISLGSLLPVFLMAIRWPQNFGDDSQIGMILSNLLFQMINAVVLGVCLWLMFDPPFSPRDLSMFSSPGLTFYFLTALSIGYYSGYFLLVFGRWMGRKTDPGGLRRRHATLEKFLVQKFGILVTVAVSLLAIIGLACKNQPEIVATNSDILHQYGSLMLKSLPAKSGVILCDSDNRSYDLPWRLFVLEAELARNGLDKKFVPIDTLSFVWPAYHRFLHKKYPDQWPLKVSEQETEVINPVNLINLLLQLGKTNGLFYLNPSFGYYFEQFYLEPHGLIYQMKPLPHDTLLPALPNKQLVAENEAFWAAAQKPLFAQIEHDIHVNDADAKLSLAKTWLAQLHVTPAVNPNASLAGLAFSQILNCWGVQLQRMGKLSLAANHFEDALRLNPDNVAAGVNREFNYTLQAGKKPESDFTDVTPDQFGRYRSWNEVLVLNGPFDDPNYCFNNGMNLFSGAYYREALAELSRVSELCPDSLVARLFIGQIYIMCRKPDRALHALQEPMVHPAKFGLNATNSTMLNITAAAAYLEQTNNKPGVELMKLEIGRHPDDQLLWEAVAKGCLSHNLPAEALEFINKKLRATPNDSHWLMGKGFALVQLKSYPQAVEAFSQVLAVETNNYEALFDRAIAYLNAEQYDAARVDYLRLQQNFTNAYPVAYGLSDIAMHRQDTNEAIRNCRIYLANAPTNTAEYTLIRQRLATLHAP